MTEVLAADTRVAEYSLGENNNNIKKIYTLNNISCSTASAFQLGIFGSELMKALSEYQLEGVRHPDVFNRS